MKGTGAIRLTESASGEREFVIKRSARLSEFDEFLAPFRGKPRRATFSLGGGGRVAAWRAGDARRYAAYEWRG